MAKDVTSLRSALEWLKSEGLLIETDKEVNPDLEITGLQKHFDGGPPILFNNVKTKPHARAVTNLGLRTVVLASGGMSHFPGTDRYSNPELAWDNAVLDRLRKGVRLLELDGRPSRRRSGYRPRS